MADDLLKLPQADPRVNYGAPIEDDDSYAVCGACRFFNDDACSLVEGTIDPEMTCDLWTDADEGSTTASEPGGESSGGEDAASGGGDAGGNPGGAQGGGAHDEPYDTVFIDATELFADPATFEGPQWIPFLPKPGTYTHVKYGAVNIDLDRNRRMVTSVKDKVYQDKIPLDLEHDLKVSGASAWLSDMKMNEDGSADAYVEFTGRGKKVLSEQRFRYISPEWFRQWQDPATGQEYHDIIVGGALTTRPFFKDKSMRALVASERGAEIIGPEQHKEGVPMAGKNGAAAAGTGPEDEPDDEPEPSETMSEADLESFVETRITAAVDKVTQTFTEKLTTETTARAAAETALKTLTDERRTDRFTSIVTGRAGEGDGAPWVGGADKHVPVLVKFAETFGEDSQEFKDYVELQSGIAAQMKTSELFSEIGSDASGSSGKTAQGKLEAMAAAIQKDKPELTKEQAFSEALSTPEGARLYSEAL